MKFSVCAVVLYLFLSTNLLFPADTTRSGDFDSGRKDSGGEALKKVAERLGSLKTLKYSYRRELNYSSENYRNLLVADSFLDFTSVDKIIGVRYQFNTENALHVFNGSERFEINRKNKSIKIDNKPGKEAFESFSFFYNSPLTLRNVLSKIASDETIPRTVSEKNVAGQSFYEIEFTLNKKTLDALGDYSPVTLDRKIIYRLTVNKTDYLPVEMLQTNSANQDFIKTSFDNIQADTNAAAPKETSWYFSSYLNEYRIEKPELKNSRLVAAGQTAAGWTLPVFDGAERAVSLSRFRGKLVLLEFWISFCGYCIAAVPHLNALSEKYKNRDFKLLAVNVHDSKEVIKLFQKNNQPSYEILTSGEEVAKTYGVEGYPTVVLIDKKGIVIYAGSFDKDLLAGLIDKNLR